MKVLILSTYESIGGAAIAANRLLHALQKNGVEATMMCRKNLSWWKGKMPQSLTSIVERGMIWACNGFAMKDLWTTDLMLLGQDITKTREYREADVIHLHWVQQGFISLATVERMIKDGKRVVWTMHDAWNAMGAYHLALNRKDTFLERWTANRKAKLYAGGKIQFVTCSEWLKGEAMKSPLMAGQNVVAIPNPIDIDIFKTHTAPSQRENTLSFPPRGEEKDGCSTVKEGTPEGTAHRLTHRVLFVAQNVNNPYKGMQYLEEAAKMLEGVEIVALGRDIPYIKDTREMARLYASVDAFVLPSLSENLPNTIMEAMACGTPCVGFNVGGIPEMIDHKQNGYIAEYKNAADLAQGIRFVLDNNATLSQACVQKIHQCYSEKAVAERYKELYDTSLLVSEK